MKQTFTETGVVAELNGEYWGIQRQDGKVCYHGFGPINKAEITDPKYCKKATDYTYKSSPYYDELKKAKLKRVTVSHNYDIQD